MALGDDDDEGDDPDDNGQLDEDLARWCEAILPLLSFAADRQEASTSVVVTLVLVLVLRALAG